MALPVCDDFDDYLADGSVDERGVFRGRNRFGEPVEVQLAPSSAFRKRPETAAPPRWLDDITGERVNATTGARELAA